MNDARARAGDVGTVGTVGTEGQRRLRIVPYSLSVIAGAVGTDKGTVSCWRNGSKIPSPPLRARLHSTYGIEPVAWDRVPLGSELTHREAPSATVGTSASATRSSLDETLDALEQVKDLLADPTIAANERKGLLDNLSKLLALRSRLEEKAELLESRIVREHPRWVEIRRGLPDILRPYPQAAEAVAAWLTDLEVDA